MSAEPPRLPGDMLARLVERAPVGMSVHDPDGRCILMNQVLADINGVEIDDAIGRTIHEYLPSLAHTLQPHFDEVIATGAEVRVEIQGTTGAAPGRPRWWHATFRPIAIDDVTAGVAVVAEDVTERMQQLETLAEREMQLRRVFENIDQGFCICDIIVDDNGRPVDYRFVEVNGLFEEMTGLTNATGRTAYELVPGLEASWVEAYGRVALEGETLRFEQESDVMGRWFDVFATPVATPGRFAIVFRDETARHLAEAAESEVSERYRAMADQLPLIVWMHGPDGKQEFVNLTYCDYFGVERELMIADEWQVLTHPDDSDRYVASFDRAVAERSEFHEQLRVQDGSGRWRWLESWARPRFGPNGEFLGHLGASADITDRVEAELALAASTAFLRNVLDSLFTFVGVLEPNGTVLQANRAPLEAAEIELADVVGKKFWDCVWWSYDEGVASDLLIAVGRAAGGDDVRYDAPVRVARNEPLWIDFQLKPLRDPAGTITHIIASGLDITDRLDAERQRAQTLSEERDRRQRAELLEEHAAHLASAVGPAEVAALTVEHLEQHVGVGIAAVNLRRDDQVELITSESVPADRRPDRIALDDDLPGPAAIVSNQPIVFGERADIVERYPGLGDTLATDGVNSLVALPVRNSKRVALGAIVVGSPDASAFRGPGVALLEGFAEQCGLALERALLHEKVVIAQQREHEVALRLQRALLPDRLVEHPQVAVAARYEAAGEHLEVGGDWYDTFEWPSGEVGVMVGDVAGHDLDAAAAMGRLRAAVAALAPTLAPDPAAILEALHDVARGPDGTAFVTAVCAVIDPATGIVDLATAGHLPPVWIRPSGAVLVPTEQVAPLGLLELDFVPATRIQLEAGDCVLLYSDGLVERRHELIDVGLERLLAACDRILDQDLDLFVRWLVDDLTSSGVDDDNVALALRWLPTS